MAEQKSDTPIISTPPGASPTLDQREIDNLLAQQASNIDAALADSFKNKDRHEFSESNQPFSEPEPESTSQQPAVPEPLAEPVPEPPEPDAVAAEQTTESHSELDVLLQRDDVDSVLATDELDSALLTSNDATDQATDRLDQTKDDDVLTQFQSDAASSSTEIKPLDALTASRVETMTQDAVEQLLAEENSEVSPKEQVVAENLAAAVPSETASIHHVIAQDNEGDLLTQEMLDALIADAKTHKQQEPAPVSAAEVPVSQPVISEVSESDTPPEAPKTSEAESSELANVLTRWRTRRRGRMKGLADAVRKHGLRLTTSLAAGLIFSIGTFVFLYANPYQSGSVEAPERQRMLDEWLRLAQNDMDDGQYAHAIAILDEAIANAAPSRLRTDAEFLRLEAQYLALTPNAPAQDREAVHAATDELIERAHSHPRAPEALQWKAKLYETEGVPMAAYQTYQRILSEYANALHLDDLLLNAADNAFRVNRPVDAQSYLSRLLNEFPGSPRSSEARLRLGDAYQAVGKEKEARETYLQVAKAHPDDPLGAKAYSRLADMAFAVGKFDEAVRLLESRLETTTSLEGNEEIFLSLARTYRAAKKPEEAERVLRELISFFPESDATPKAFILLSQVLEELGRRQEAVRLAKQTAQRYPENYDALANEGCLLSAAGDAAAAAQSFLAADAAGAAMPQYLLEAARQFHAAGALNEAFDAYRRLVTNYPGAPEAFDATIEQANVLYAMGKVRKALEQLENLAIATEGKPQGIAVLAALGELCQKLDLQPRTVDVYLQMAATTSEPEMLAKAAIALFEADAATDGLRIAERIDASKLKPATAYKLLLLHGKTLLRITSERGIEKMESAYNDYPAERTAAGDEMLLEAYLVADKPARARALIMELEAHVQANNVDAPRLMTAAVKWADYLYDREDYRAAADAYALAMRDATESSSTVLWATYQRANSLLNIGEYNESIPLYERLAASNAQWAGDAAMKADYARINKRFRKPAVKG